MKVGDLVRYSAQVWPEGTGWDSQRERVGLVLETHSSCPNRPSSMEWFRG